MQRFTLALTLGAALAASFACGGAGELPVTQPAPVAPAPDSDATEAAPEGVPAETTTPAPEALPAEQPAAQPAETPAPAFTGKGPDTTTLGSDKGAQGPTEFPHWAHQQRGTKCGSCHHNGMKSCGKGSDCHQATEVNAPSAKDAFHGRCKACHKKQGLPTGCDFCHRPKAS